MVLSNNMQITADFGSNGSLLLGGEKEFSFSLSNLSDSEKMYNVSAILTLSNNLSIVSSVPSWTYSDTSDNTYTTTNFKDFSANEVNIPISYNISSANMVFGKDITYFGESVGVSLNVTWDSMPRGSEDIGNIEYYTTFTFLININRLELITSLPSKQLKGAGSSTSEATNTFSFILSVYNTTEISSTFTLENILPNGFRYLGEYTYLIEPATSTIPIPTISDLNENNQQIMTWSNITLLQGEYFSVEFSCSIYERYAESQTFNIGEIITHGTELTSYLSLLGEDIIIEEVASTTAMDLIIFASQTETVVDIGIMYDLFYSITIGGYFSFENLSLYCEVSDGLSILSAPTGTIGGFSIEGYTPVTFAIDSMIANETLTKTISVIVDELYTLDEDFVYSGDIFTTFSVIEGTNTETAEIAMDTGSNSQQITLPTITKELISIQYRNGTAKTIDTVAPLDFITYRLRYDSTGISAVQKNILLDDFFPLDCDLPTDENVVQLQGDFISSETISPHGLRWILGDLTEPTIWEIEVTAQVLEDATDLLNDNLFKLTGDKKNGETYSLRENVTFVLGMPNITFTRVIEDVDINAIKSSDVLKAVITIVNEQSDTATDAFNFRMIANLSGGVTFDPSGIVVTEGTGSVSDVVTTDTTASITIDRLLVGEYLVLTYYADIPDLVAPSTTYTVASQLEIPYTQYYDVLEDNVKYLTSAYKSNYTINSEAIDISYYTDKTTAEIGEDLNYTFKSTVPLGTVIYNYSLEDLLHEHQVYVGNAYINGEEVIPSISDNTIIFPELAELDSRELAQDVEYKFTANILSGGTESQELQTSTATFLYEDSTGTEFSDFATTTVTIGNPQLTLSVTSSGETIYTNKDSTITINIGNSGEAGITDLVVNVPLSSDVVYKSSTTTKGTLIFDEDSNTLTFSMGDEIFETTDNVTITITLRCDSETYSGDTFSFYAQSLPYKNTESETQEYPSVTSQTFYLTAEPSLLLSIYAPYRNQNHQGYVMVSPNTTATVPYNIINNGGGIDSVILSVTASKYPYTINVGSTIYATVPENTAYSGTPAPLEDLTVGTINTIDLVFAIPDTQLYDTNPFVVTATSATDESVTMSIDTFMIDPW